MSDVLAFAIGVTAPIAIMTSFRAAMSLHGMRPFALAPGEGTSVENPTGGITTFKAVSDQSGGGLTAIEVSPRPEKDRRCTCTASRTSSSTPSMARSG